MIPDPGEILRRRVTSATIVRILAFVPLFAAASLGAIWGYEANENRLYSGEHIGYAVGCGVFVGFGIFMWVVAPWHARRSVKMPKSVVCPACNYKIAGLAEARCPECGLPLTAEFISLPGEKTPPPRDPDRTTMRQLSTAVLRLVGVLGIIGTAPVLIFAIVEAVQLYLGNGSRRYGSSEIDPPTLVMTTVFFAMFLSLAVFGPRISGFIVPKRTRFARGSELRALSAMHDAPAAKASAADGAGEHDQPPPPS